MDNKVDNHIFAFTRPKFLNTVSIAATSLAVAPPFTFAGEPTSDRKARIGTVG